MLSVCVCAQCVCLVCAQFVCSVLSVCALAASPSVPSDHRRVGARGARRCLSPFSGLWLLAPRSKDHPTPPTPGRGFKSGWPLGQTGSRQEKLPRQLKTAVFGQGTRVRGQAGTGWWTRRPTLPPLLADIWRGGSSLSLSSPRAPPTPGGDSRVHIYRTGHDHSHGGRHPQSLSPASLVGLRSHPLGICPRHQVHCGWPRPP